MNVSRIHSSLLLLALFALIGCQEKTPGNLPTVQMQLGGMQFTLEVASTPEARQRGLMRRDSMPADHGMIFVFTETRPLAFYMKNTRIPLDIIYLDDNGKVVSIKQMKPYDMNSTPSGAPARWAIELNQGAAAKAGVNVGDVVQVPEAARKGQP